MKIWSGYGSEHSMNLVMIGHFKSTENAKDMLRLFEDLTAGLEDIIDFDAEFDRYSEEVFTLLKKLGCHSLNNFELEQFSYDSRINVHGDKIVITTDETDVSAFFKLMVLKGARVEIFSGHDYPDADYGRGK